MNQSREKWIAGVMIFAFLLAMTVPYLYANSNADGTRVFGGLLLNPIDGNSYLAKMRQGFEGSWLFTLPYTNHPGEGAALNLYYLFLGHVARTLGWSLIFTFHLARVIGAFLLALAIYQLLRKIIPDPGTRLLALGLTLFGSGLGWIAAALSLFTSDFWVAEAYPFLSSFANAHFPIGLALQAWLLSSVLGDPQADRKQDILTFFSAALLSVIYPFGWVVAIAVSAIWTAWLFWSRSDWKPELTRWIWMLLGGAPYVLYSFWIINNHPILSVWNAQNLTPAPSLLDLAISFSPALVLAIFEVVNTFRQNGSAPQRALTLAIWFIAGLLIVYLPLNLQRRLISGFFIPLAALAIIYAQGIRVVQFKKALIPILVIFSLPTNLLILAGGIKTISDKDPAIYIYRDELAAFSWLDQYASPDSLVLSSPNTGLLIPVYSDAQVLYGHPFETVEADMRLAQVESFFSGEMSVEAQAHLLETEAVDFIFYGPREGEIGHIPTLDGWGVVYEQGAVQVLAPIG